ncbi:hypothetical protein HYW21_08115 [Candidatus Woesearchaeota archaeon]|nr:hypothetical protein [Candidatus Woesearchaeota archaeon]
MNPQITLQQVKPKGIALHVVLFTLISLVLGLLIKIAYPSFSWWHVFRASLAFIYATLLPGYVFVYCYLSYHNLRWPERFGLSFAISMVIIIFLFMFTSQLLRIPFVSWISIVLLFGVMIIMFLFRKKSTSLVEAAAK